MTQKEYDFLVAEINKMKDLVYKIDNVTRIMYNTLVAQNSVLVSIDGKFLNLSDIANKVKQVEIKLDSILEEKEI